MLRVMAHAFTLRLQKVFSFHGEGKQTSTHLVTNNIQKHSHFKSIRRNKHDSYISSVFCFFSSK